MRTHSIICLTALCLLGACNQPAVSLKDPAFQPSENTVRDWNDIAREIASALKDHSLLVQAPAATGQQDASTNQQDGSANQQAASTKPIFIRVQAPDSAFLQTVAAKLEAEVLRSGGTIVRSPGGATVVNLNVDFVNWSRRDKPPQRVFEFDPLGLGLAMTPTNNSEAIWQASVVTDSQTLLRVEEPIYIRDKDTPLYAKSATLMPLASWSDGDPALPIRPLRFAP